MKGVDNPDNRLERDLEMPLPEAPPVPPPLAEQIVYDRLKAEQQTERFTVAKPDEAQEPVVAPAEATKVGEMLLDAAEVEPQEEIELDRERRHEIKDHSVQSIGQVLAEIHQSTLAAHTNFQPPQPVPVEPAGQSQARGFSLVGIPVIGQLPPLYQRSIASGLISGLALAVIWLILNSF